MLVIYDVKAQPFLFISIMTLLNAHLTYHNNVHGTFVCQLKDQGAIIEKIHVLMSITQ